MSLLCYEKFCDIITLRPSNLITTLTYVLMDVLCPCFLKYLWTIGKLKKVVNYFEDFHTSFSTPYKIFE